jgi:hypothetical protein
MREAVDEPGLGYVLHPGTDQRDDLTGSEEAEVAVAQRAKGLLDTMRFAGGRDSGGS